jgi:methionyl-tRNA formyltransferase
MNKLKIVFMGTPNFAVGILDAILKSNHEIVAVITAPDKPSGRGQQVKFSDVKNYALENHLHLLQPTNLKDETFLINLKALNANLQVVVAFRMLPKVVWEMPALGTFNLHASLLPNYRGAAPINWAIINGETKTGVTTFFIDEKIDTGAMILSEMIEITENENAGQLHDKLMLLGQNVVLKTLELIQNNKAETTIQTQGENIKTAFKLDKDNCKIDWNKNGIEIYNLVRGLSPYPSAWTFIEDKNQQWNVKIEEVLFENTNHSSPIGTIFATKKEIKVAVADGWIYLQTVQFPGKKKMKVYELLNGFLLTENAKVC